MGNVCECIKDNNFHIINEIKLDDKCFRNRRKLNISIEKSKGNIKEITKETSKENSAIMKNINNNKINCSLDFKTKNENLFTINDSISIIEANQNEEVSFLNNEEINRMFQVNETNNFENYQNKKQIQTKEKSKVVILK